MTGNVGKFRVLHGAPDTNAYVSSGDVANVTTGVADTADLPYTIMNWGRVGPSMENAHHPGSTTSVGPFLDYLSEHPEVGAVVTLLIVAAAVGNGMTTASAIQRKKERDSYKAMYKALDEQAARYYVPDACSIIQVDNVPNEEKLDDIPVNTNTAYVFCNGELYFITKSPKKCVLVPADRATTQRVDNLCKREARVLTSEELDLTSRLGFAPHQLVPSDRIDLNVVLNKALQKNKELKARYKQIRVTQVRSADNNVIGWDVEMEKNPEAPFWQFWKPNSAKAPWLVRKAVNVADATSDTLGLASYAYWLFFIAAAVFTGSAAFFGVSAGISGVADWLAFGAPLAVGGTYAVWKLKNQVANRDLQREDHDAFNALAQQALFDNEADTTAPGRVKVATYKIVVGAPDASPTPGTVYVTSQKNADGDHEVYYEVVQHNSERLTRKPTRLKVAKAIDTDIPVALKVQIMEIVANDSKAGATRQIEVSNSNNKAGIFNAALVALLSAYAGWQYIFWFTTDMLAKAGVAVESASSALGATALVFGLVALTRTIVVGVMDGYKEFKNTPGNEKKGFRDYARESISNGFRDALAMVSNYIWKPREHYSDYFKLDSTIELGQQTQVADRLCIKLEELEAACARKGINIPPLLAARLEQLKTFEKADATNSTLQSIRNFFQFGAFGASGVYLARTVLVQGTTSFLLPGLGAAFCLSNPITIGLLVGIGIAWGLYRYYHYRKKKNEEKMAHQNEKIRLMEQICSVLDHRLKDHPTPTIAVRVDVQPDVRPDRKVEQHVGVSPSSTATTDSLLKEATPIHASVSSNDSDVLPLLAESLHTRAASTSPVAGAADHYDGNSIGLSVFGEGLRKRNTSNAPAAPGGASPVNSDRSPLMPGASRSDDSDS